jgi:hypothetical protein
MLRKLLLVGALALVPVAAQAAATVVSAGPRVGVSLSPDQFVFGGQLSLREFAPDWSFDPNLEIGFGDHEETIAPNFDVLYHLRLSGSDWRPYVGGGLALTFVSEDRPFPDRDANQTDVGLNAVIGITAPTDRGSRWFAEMRFGLGDVANLKVVGGLNFKL